MESLYSTQVIFIYYAQVWGLDVKRNLQTLEFAQESDENSKKGSIIEYFLERKMYPGGILS